MGVEVVSEGCAPDRLHADAPSFLPFCASQTDGTDPYIIEYLVPHGASGIVTYQEYSNDYYGHFFNYTQQVNGDHCLIMSRPVDSYQLLDNSIGVYIEFSPKYVLFSGWVGDQDPSFEGLQNALFNMIHSAWSNYTGFGSDIGGYRSGPGPNGRTTEVCVQYEGASRATSTEREGRGRAGGR